MDFVAGSIDIEELSITNFDGSETQDMKSFFVGLQINESIFENVISGQISILDSVGLHQLLPIIGEETIRIRYRTTDDSKVFDKNFRITKLSDFEKISDKNVAYTLYFVSPELVSNEKIRVRQSFKGQTAEQIMQKMFVLLESDKAINSDATAGVHSLVIGDMKPLQAINMLTTYSQSKQYEGSLYLFFENRDGYNFRTIESLYAGDTVTKLSQQVVATEQPTDQSFSAFISYRLPQKFDNLGAISRGMFNNKVVGVDIIAKSFKTNTFNYMSQFDNQTHLDDGIKFASDNFSDTTSQMFKLVNSRSLRSKSSYYRAHNETSYTFSKTMEDMLPGRISQIHQASYLIGEVMIWGNTDLKAGDVIEIQFPSTAYQDKNSEQITDPIIEGRYLIRDITHTITTSSFKQKLTVVKDSYRTKPKNDK